MSNKLKGLIQRLQILSDALPKGYVRDGVEKDIVMLKSDEKGKLYLTIKNKYNV